MLARANKGARIRMERIVSDAPVIDETVATQRPEEHGYLDMLCSDDWC